MQTFQRECKNVAGNSLTSWSLRSFYFVCDVHNKEYVIVGTTNLIKNEECYPIMSSDCNGGNFLLLMLCSYIADDQD